jgi:hypothetical protein
MNAYDSLHFVLDYKRFVSSAMTDLVLIYESVTSSASIAEHWTLLLLNRSSLHGFLYCLPLTVENVCCLSVVTETCFPNRCLVRDYFASIRCCGRVCLTSRWLAIDFHVCSLPRKHMLPNRCLTMVIFVTILSLPLVRLSWHYDM